MCELVITSFVSALQPNLDSYIFFRVNADVEGVLVDEETAEARYVCLSVWPPVSVCPSVCLYYCPPSVCVCLCVCVCVCVCVRVYECHTCSDALPNSFNHSR